eukprot:TRINITY_DN7182_c0_g1_i5.p1 TRINITY_DN7182_c0_g1~~TRINITY_DN7182_c0_g1_i5.p1  ORF type:complete len:108 (-),score=29.49 TRINITY_DN7182_c0_g1_i5:132-455(-)
MSVNPHPTSQSPSTLPSPCGPSVSFVFTFTCQPMTMSILSERRALAPPGFDGGEDGERGLNLLIRNQGTENEKIIHLGGKNSVFVHPGDTFVVMTPGGGGYGKPPTE